MSDTVKGYCRTNLDEFKREQWPTEFVRCPIVGDRVVSLSGRRLHVVGVTHLIDRDGKPTVEVELHRMALRGNQ